MQKGGREIATFLLRNSCLLSRSFTEAVRMSYTPCTMGSWDAMAIYTPSMEVAGLFRGQREKYHRETSFLVSSLVPCRESCPCAAHCVGVEGAEFCRTELKCSLTYIYSLAGGIRTS